MLHETFSRHLEIAPDVCDSLMERSLDEFLSLSAVQQLLGSLNVTLLRETLPTAGELLAAHLPPFYDWLKTELNVQRVPDSPKHATTWVVNFLNNKERLDRLVELHAPVPRTVLEQATPRLVGVFDVVEEPAVRQEWQKAVAALCLVLAVGARDVERAVQSASNQ